MPQSLIISQISRKKPHCDLSVKKSFYQSILSIKDCIDHCAYYDHDGNHNDDNDDDNHEDDNGHNKMKF